MDILLIAVLILANGLCSGSEIAIVSARKLRLEHLAERGNRGAAAALRLARAPNDFLSTVQIGITLIGILSGAVGGATIAQRLRPVLTTVPLLGPHAETLSVALVVTVITFLSLVIGELVPKRIALNDPERLACAVAPAMRTLARWSAPLVHLLSSSTDTLLNLLGVRASEEPEITEEDIRALLRQGAESGVVEETEHQMVQRVFRLGDRSVKAVMTPRTDIRWLDANESLEETIREILVCSHSLFPVGQGSLDACIGVLRGSNLLAARLSGEPVSLASLLQPPLYVTESARALTVIERFRSSGVHIALVTDEYGGIEGLVTLNDIMEAIVGELPSVEDREDPLIVEREDGSWLLDGSLDIADFLSLVQRKELVEASAGSFHTLGGFVLHRLERIPTAGDHFEWEGLRLEVVDMDGNRVDKVLVIPPPTAPAAPLTP